MGETISKEVKELAEKAEAYLPNFNNIITNATDKLSEATPNPKPTEPAINSANELATSLNNIARKFSDANSQNLAGVDKKLTESYAALANLEKKTTESANALTQKIRENSTASAAELAKLEKKLSEDMSSGLTTLEKKVKESTGSRLNTVEKAIESTAEKLRSLEEKVNLTSMGKAESKFQVQQGLASMEKIVKDRLAAMEARFSALAKSHESREVKLTKMQNEFAKYTHQLKELRKEVKAQRVIILIISLLAILGVGWLIYKQYQSRHRHRQEDDARKAAIKAGGE